jgi:hypothetical protein
MFLFEIFKAQRYIFYEFENLFNLNALLTTDTELKLIAAAANLPK